ncbi:hypothetical protein BACCIP111895_00601 [Neobacillus rhizosphaerae]|uniref:Uncharacterized protein n=1 Tax=Neobacillus rhizosphaerae TaxID=2880965 RepID=A0ABM9ELJ0_9BACI|nr:hypothetical protein [Neobacillus rhizosphaerae]CAH2713465.1 hypothetical protein BACCIP111895_00601 [Neobacillus rhizosphaerae]
MKKRITIQKASTTENKLFLETKEPVNGLVPAEQMLVDSVQFSFIYLMENQEDYTYIVFPEQIWPFLKSALEQNIPVLLTFREESIELISFHEELEYLITNIKGNSNYGNEMVTKVEENF